MTSQIDQTPNAYWKEKESIGSSHHLTPVKSMKRIKSPKKFQGNKKSVNDVKIEDVFLNSEYFKYHTGNISSLSFCSGDNGENQWTVDSKFEIPLRRKATKMAGYPSDTIKSDTAVGVEKEKVSKRFQQKIKKPNCSAIENIQESTEKLLEGILTGKEKVDRDLITLITDQMFLAERELQITRTHLIETISKLNERDLEILQLHEKIQNLQKDKSVKADNSQGLLESHGSTKSSEDYQRLMRASEKLKKQVKDMEEFLNDYGIVWVEDKETNQKVDFDKIIKSFQRLNSVASEPKIIQTAIGAKFEIPREISVVLYSNGLFLRNEEFREYNKASTIAFLQDVEDGYFPSELQSEFPDGVPFEVTDKRHEVYNKNGKIPVFQGQGNRLGSTCEDKPPSVVYLEPLKQNRNLDSVINHECLHKHALKKIQKKKSRNLYLQDDKIMQLNGTSHRFMTDYSEKETSNFIKVKIRFGKIQTESFLLQIKGNQKMSFFQAALQRGLCEKYHEKCIVESESNNRFTDFLIHVYGKTPFRLSEHLNKYPEECGISSNCLINVTEI